jgi:hypothetical protein
MNIILNGPGRSGTTLLSQLLSYHQDLAWISGWVNRYPKFPELAFFNFMYRMKIMNFDVSKIDKMPKPAEAYGFWKYYVRNFNSDNQPAPDEITRLKQAMERLLNIQNKNHFITKITGDLRKNIFDQIFSDYQVVWIERDPRVVVSSYIKQRWFYKDRTNDFEKLTMEEKIRFYAEYYLSLFEQSKTVERKIVFYEDLCNNPVPFFENLLGSLNLNFSEQHRSRIKNEKIKLVDWSNYEVNYTQHQKKLLSQLLEEPLEYYKYS